MGDGTKYLEGNYTASNPFTAVKEYWEDAEQAKGLENDEEYMKAFLQAMKAGREENHYLVDGAVLACTRCTLEPKTPLKESFTAPEGSGRTLLKVTQNRTARNGAEQYFATVKDCQKFDNIEPFGNCQNPPDREKEKKALMLAEMITMESILFCKHGGFIYPKESGYIMTDNSDEMYFTEEEIEFAEKFRLTDVQCYALKDIRKYFEDNPELMEKTTIFAFEGLGSYSGGVNSYHPNGQYGALIIVAKGGKLVYATANASTLPDNPVSATVNGGVYQTIYKFHSGTYAALQVRNLETGADGIDACYHESQGI